MMGRSGAHGRVEAAWRAASEWFEQLLEAVFYACFDGIVESREPDRSEGPVWRRAHRQTVAMMDVLREELDRHGMTVGELDASLGWSAGRAETVFACPSELLVEEAVSLCQELELSMVQLFDLMEREAAAPSEKDPAGGS